jgi:uncharacterized protein YndB with AHSA1/START domain
MNNTIRREILIPQPREAVWAAITESATLAQWMFPNDFVATVGHRFTFQVPGNPAMKFEGLTVRCEVLELDPPSRLAFSWCVAGPVADTRVVFRLEPEGAGTRLFLEHSGFDLAAPHAKQAFKGADYGWANMLSKLLKVSAGANAGPD